jgi:hypothetical protein
MAATTVPSMPAIDISKLATLDERTPAPPRTAARDAFAPPPSSTPSHFLSQAFKPPPEAGELGEEELIVERSTRAIRLANQFRDAEVPEPDALSADGSSRTLRSSRSPLRTPSSPPGRASQSSLHRPSSPPLRPSQSSLRSPASASGSSTALVPPAVRGAVVWLAVAAVVAIAVLVLVMHH